MRNNSDPAGPFARPTMRFIPWDRMTPVEQAEHLVLAHGFDIEYEPWPDYFDAEHTPRTDADVVAWFARRVGPHRRREWHDGDHEEYAHGGADRCLHTHDKPA